MRNFTSDNVEVSLDSITSIRFGDYLNSIPLPAILAVFHAEELDNYGLFTVDSNLIYSIVDVLLGGRRGSSAMRIEGRPYTTIERTLVQRMVEVILQDMCAAFEPLAPVNFSLDRLETNPRFAAIARPANAAILVKLRIDMEDRGGRTELLLPYATLEPIRKLLLQQFMGEKFGRDSIWESHLATELWSTKVDIEAILDEQTMPLNQIMNLEVGQTMMLGAGPDSKIKLRCRGVPLLTGRMGRVGSSVAVQGGCRRRTNRRLQGSVSPWSPARPVIRISKRQRECHDHSEHLTFYAEIGPGNSSGRSRLSIASCWNAAWRRCARARKAWHAPSANSTWRSRARAHPCAP